MEPTLQTLAAALERCTVRDRSKLAARLAALDRRLARGHDIARTFADLHADVQAAEARCRERAQRAPVPSYPDDLPVVHRKSEIASLIREHQVVVICGETGSGKSTQLPKICLELGRGVRGMIAHTQPRRIAARTLAARIASELHAEMGHAVGFKVRFTDQVGKDTYVKLLTDGMLLAETEGDRRLEQYDTIIIDEAHERSLNIDFLLGYLKQLLPERPDLKLIITSATIDPHRFAAHFDGAPVLEVSGRTYAVEVRYRPPAPQVDEDQGSSEAEENLVRAVHELVSEGSGDILVFLPTERAIRELTFRLHGERLRGCEVLPLFARLSNAEQGRIFAPHNGRRIVLATNVAETSLTVPGIRYVIDTGLARISRYDVRRGVARLPIERISQASAAQRAGRCGRTSEGICIRLYSEDDWTSRPPFTTPEIARTNLAAVVLKMAALGLGEVERFPFVEPPDRRSLRDGYDTLVELGALDAEYRLTALGGKLAKLPVDPRVARMILAAKDQRCVREVLVIAAALSVQDPRERPKSAEGRADEAHRRFTSDDSDFSFYLKLYRTYEEECAGAARSKRKQWCEKHFVSYVRILEWLDVHAQLEQVARELDLTASESRREGATGGDDAVHRALLTGLLRNVAMRFDDRVYVGARNVKMNVFPGSTLFKKRPPWIMAAEVVETERLYARTLAKIDPAWIEPLAEHLVSRTYSEPHYDARRGQVVGFEKVTLYGLPLVTQRKVDWARIDAESAREIFIRTGLVEGELITRAPFAQHNAELVRRVSSLSEKLRSRDVTVDEQAVYAFYDARVPHSVTHAASFERWRKDVERENPEVLNLRPEDVLSDRARSISEADYPATLHVAGHDVSLRYRFLPGEADDGVTALLPLPIVHRLTPHVFEWLVPGLLFDKVFAMIESLPKAIRRELQMKQIGTTAEIAKRCEVALRDRIADRPLTRALADALVRVGGPTVDAAAFRLDMVAPHLFMRFEVLDEAGLPAASSRDLSELQVQLLGRASKAFARVPKSGLERERVTRWDFGELPERVDVPYGSGTIPGYPALAERDGHVALVIADTELRAKALHRAGVRALLAETLGDVVKHVRRALPGVQAACLQYALLGTCDELRSSIVDAAIDRVGGLREHQLRSQSEFELTVRELRGRLAGTADEVAKRVADTLTAYQRVIDQLGRGARDQGFGPMQVRAHLDRLVYPGFARETPWAALEQLPRYVRAVELRLVKLRENPAKHQARSLVVEPLFAQYDARVAAAQPEGAPNPALESYRWMLEEFHLFTFAEELKPAKPVSQKRLAEAWSALA